MKPEIDFASATWRALVEIVESRIDELRRKNDGDLSIERTSHLRGGVAELKQLLAIAKKSPATATDEDQFPLRQ
jgi:hypothetical protein